MSGSCEPPSSRNWRRREEEDLIQVRFRAKCRQFGDFSFLRLSCNEDISLLKLLVPRWSLLCKKVSAYFRQFGDFLKMLCALGSTLLVLNMSTVKLLQKKFSANLANFMIFLPKHLFALPYALLNYSPIWLFFPKKSHICCVFSCQVGNLN